MNALAVLVASATAMPVWQWENPSPHGGTLSAVHGEGSRLWAVGDRGAMLTSSDAGVTWTAIESGTVDALRAIGGTASLVVIVGDRGTVLRSRDGVTFTRRSLAAQTSLVGVAVAAKTVFTVGSDGSVWRSTDGGDTFTALPKLPGMPTSVAIAPSGVFVGTANGLLRSVDAGATFAAVLAEPVQRIVVRGETIHALAGTYVRYPSLRICGSCTDVSYEVAALYRSTDGATWKRRTLEDPARTNHAWGAPTAPSPPASPPPGAWGHGGLGRPYVTPALGPRSLAIGSNGEIYAMAHELHVSTDGTAFVTRKARGALWAAPKVLVTGELARSSDHGASWQSAVRSMDVQPSALAAMPDGRVLAIASEGSLIARDKGWRKIALPLTSHQRLRDIVALDKHHVIVVGEGGVILQSTDGGKTFAHRASDSTQDLGSVWGSGDQVFASGREVLLYSNDRGATWESIRAKGYRMGRLWGTSATDLWLLGDGVMHSTDRGRTWREVAPELGGMYSAIWGSAPDDVYIAGLQGRILHSRDRGKTWKSRSSGTTKDLRQLWGRGDELFAIGSEGYDRGPVVLHSLDRGRTWTEEMIHADIALLSIAGTDDAVYVTGTGGAILRRELP